MLDRSNWYYEIEYENRKAWAIQDFLDSYARDAQSTRTEYENHLRLSGASAREILVALDVLENFAHETHEQPVSIREDSYLCLQKFQKRFHSTWHVGDMKGRPTSPTGSYEYGMLSISSEPDAWESIAKLGGRPRFLLQRKDKQRGIFLNILKVGKMAAKYTLLDHVANDLVFTRDCTKATWFDNELEEDVSVLYNTIEDAEAEHSADATYTQVETYVASDELLRMCGASPERCLDGRELALVAEAEHAGYDGVWWNERLDETRLSAPRGGIFQSKLNEWNAVEQKLHKNMV